MSGRIIKDNKVIEDIVETLLNPIDPSSICGAATLAEININQSSIKEVSNDD